MVLSGFLLVFCEGIARLITNDRAVPGTNFLVFLCCGRCRSEARFQHSERRYVSVVSPQIRFHTTFHYVRFQHLPHGSVIAGFWMVSSDLEAPSWRGRFGFRIVPLLLAQDYNQAKKKPKKPAKTEDNADESEAPPRRKRSRRLRGRRLSRIPEVNGGTLGMTPQIFKHHWVILIFTVVGIVTMDWVCPGGSICIIDSTSDGVILLFASGSLLLQCSYLDSTWQSYTNSVTAGIIALLLRRRN